MTVGSLSEREARILEAVILTYVETAEPAGSRTVAKRHGLGVSPATIRNTMADLEEKGFLYHPHTSAGRIPTDLAYRFYVNTLMRPVRVSAAEQRRLRRELGEVVDGAGPLERLVRRAAQALGLITGELGVAVAPRLDAVLLEKIELAHVSSDRILLVFTLRDGAVRTVYVDVAMQVPAETLAAVAMVLNERLAGLSLSEIRQTLPARLRDTGGDVPEGRELLNIFVQSADDLFQPVESSGDEVLLGRASVLANQPEFASGTRLKSLIELTEEPDLLGTLLAKRAHPGSSTITIGGEHRDPRLAPFTLITSEYRFGNLSGVLGVLGPTRMPYEKVAAIVEYASMLMSEIAEPVRGQQE
ncbi:MAG TPA: heat-inducible transcriptional repressor HrcA [Longimicrobiales bacterium]|nr:heat-inducible transcriptional repressor HrcA [Longimicrobiales bacterium]